MRKMKQTIVINKTIFIGLEDSKRTWKLCVRCDGMVVHETSMPAQYHVLHAYLEHHFPQCSIEFIYEAGFKGFTLHDKLQADGIACVVTPPHLVTQEKATRVKCDKIDARRLAINLENGDYHRCHVPDKERREDRQISRTLGQVQRNITRCKNQIRKFLDFHGFDETFPAGTWYDRDYDAVRDNLKLPDSLQFAIDILYEQLDLFRAMKKRMQKKLRELSKKERYEPVFKLLSSAPGIGWFTAIRLVLEWGEDLYRFATAKQFAKFTGLTTSEYSTGDTIRRGKITRQSNPTVRAWLIESAWTAYKRDPVLYGTFQAVYRATSSKKKAIVAVARKLAVRLRALVVTNIPYQIGVIQ